MNTTYSAEEIIKNFDPVAVRLDDSTSSVLIKDKFSNILFWIDIWHDGSDIRWDWNQIIFVTTDSNDMLKKTLEDNLDIADMASSVAIEYYEKHVQ